MIAADLLLSTPLSKVAFWTIHSTIMVLYHPKHITQSRINLLVVKAQFCFILPYA